MSITLYGIKNCDTVRAARRWLEAHQVDYRFQDLREEAPSPAQWQEWLAELGLALVNKRSTTWKQLSETQRQDVTPTSAAELLAQHPTLMKRPLLDTGRERHLGFSAKDYQALFAQHNL